MSWNTKKILAICFLVLILFGCARKSGYKQPYTKSWETTSSQDYQMGVYHKVAKGETLWKISKSYGVSVQEIAKANKISNTGSIEQGQLLFIPKGYYSKDIYSKTDQGKTKSEKSFSWPLQGKVISKFGDKKDDIVNKGIDIEASYGSLISAAKGGKVSFVGDKVKGYGKMIIVDHDNGFQTVYAHNSENLVTLSQTVKQKQNIAKVGSGGRAKSPYLHFEIRKDHKPEDPLRYLL